MVTIRISSIGFSRETLQDLEASCDHAAFNAPCVSLHPGTELYSQGLTLPPPKVSRANRSFATETKIAALKSFCLDGCQLPLLEVSSTAKLPFWEPMCCSQALGGNPSLRHPPKIFLILDLGTRLTNARHLNLPAHSIGGSYLPRFLDNTEVDQMHCNTIGSPALWHPGQDHTVERAPLRRREHMNHAASRRTGGCPR